MNAVALEDLPDLQGWVKWQVARFCSKGHATTDEFDELCDQGVLILYELHNKWKPENCPKFSAYAISLFQNRLTDHFRKELRASGRGQARKVQFEGRSHYEYHYHGMVSLDSSETFHQETALTAWDAVE